MPNTMSHEMRERLSALFIGDTQVDAIMNLAYLDESLSSMRDRWDDSIEDYFPIVADAVWLSVQDIALEYLTEHMPDAWYPPLFNGGTDA